MTSRRLSVSHRSSPPLRLRLRLLLVLSVLSGGVLSGLSCSGDTTGPAPRPTTQTFWTLALNQYALNMALTVPANTFQLTVAPLTASGVPLPGAAPVVTFQASDSSVTVDSTGHVTANFLTGLTTVTVTASAQGITIQDTVSIQVTPTPLSPALATFSMQPAVGDSAKRAIDFGESIFSQGQFAWPVTATNSAGATICDRTTPCPLLVHYTSSNPFVATIDPTTGHVLCNDTGHVVFTATTWAYGVARRDSVAFTIGYRIFMVSYKQNHISVVNVPGRSTVHFTAAKQLTLGVGAIVDFQDMSPRPVNVVFDGPAAPDTAGCLDWNAIVTTGVVVFAPPIGSGNISVFGGDTTSVGGSPGLKFFANQDFRCRRFRTPGLYKYYGTLVPSDTLIFNVKIQH